MRRPFGAQSGYANYDAYRGGGYFICDRCSQRFRRSQMCVEWDNLRVDRKCLDPRPPQMMPPNVYPEGIPFFDARPPADNPDRLQDETTLYPVVGGIAATNGQLYTAPNGQSTDPGGLSPQNLVQSPVTQGPDVLEDDVTFITGPVFAPDNT